MKKEATGKGSASTTVWKSRPIFFSSTFRDMHAERDYLRDHALPRLAERLRGRCHYLDAIDLRQGVENAHLADEAAREMQVLRVCLDEIERSRPFLVALLGDRYGWIPPAERIAAAARAAGLPVSVDVAGKSVTELEILFGVLENEEQLRRSWFYFRTLDSTSMPPEIAARFPAEEESSDPDSPAAKLQALKGRIRKQMPDRVRDYTLRWDQEKQNFVGLEDLDTLVEQDIWSDLDPETAAYLREAPQTWQEADARAVGDFVTEGIRGYVERPTVTDPMLTHALSPESPGENWGLVVTGESGSGKSSLFGNVFQTLQHRAVAGEILLLSHSAGIFPMSGQVDRMLRRWTSELAVFLEIADPFEEPASSSSNERANQIRPGETKIITSEEIEKTFASLLSKAAGQIRVVVLIDALNQFEPTIRASHLTWLPRIIPTNVRMLATAIPGTASTAMKDRPCASELAVPPVTRNEARAITEKFYRDRHHRDVNPRVLETLLDKQESGRPAHSNPLWLALALQEMNLLEADDFERADREFAHLQGTKRMEALQLAEAARFPGDIFGAYGELLDRAERLLGTNWTRAFTDLIAISRAGWRESDLREVMPLVSRQPWNDLTFAGLRRTLGNNVVQCGAQHQWNFFHVSLRQTVLRRNLTNKSRILQLHSMLVDHLESLPTDDPIRINETMVHLVGSSDRDRAARFIAEINTMDLFDSNTTTALASAVTVLVETIQSSSDATARNSIISWIASLMSGGQPERSGRVANAIIFDVNDALAVIGTNEMQKSRRQLLEAANEALQRLTSVKEYNGQLQRDLAMCLNYIGNLLLDQGDLAGALRFYQESLVVRENLALGSTNVLLWRDLSAIKERIGNVKLKHGNLIGAMADYREFLAIIERLVAEDSSNADLKRDLSICHYRIGDVMLAQGNLRGAQQAYQESMVIIEELALSDSSNTAWQLELSNSQDKIGTVLLEQGNISEAHKAYSQSLAILERLLETNPNQAVWQRNYLIGRIKIGDVLLKQEALADALHIYHESLEKLEHFAEADPNNTIWQRDIFGSQFRIGSVSLHQGDLAKALAAYRQSVAVMERLVSMDPSNTEWQCDLSSGHARIGDILFSQNDLAGALAAHSESLALNERLAAADQSNAVWQRELTISYVKMAQIAKSSDTKSATTWLRKAYVTLSEMKKRDIMQPEEEQLFEALKTAFEIH